MKSLVLAATRAAVAALGGALCACGTLESNAWNVRQLHESDGSPRPVAAVMSGFEYGLRTSLGELPVLDESGADPEGKPAGRVTNPRRRALSELLELEEYDSRDDDARWLQAELAAWLAVDADPTVERLTAVRVLGRVATVLGDVTPVAAPAAPEVDAAESSAALLALVRDLGAAARAGEAERLADLLRPFAPDLQGRESGRRLLRACALLTHEAEGGAGAVLARAADQYARRVAALALRAALDDPRREVRAEAHRLVVRLEPEAAYGLATAAADRGDTDALEAVFASLLVTGLPAEDDSNARRVEWLRLFTLHSSGDVFASYPGALPTTACRCLARFSGAGLSTLRSEEWVAWFERNHGPLEGDPVDASAESSATGGPAEADEADEVQP